MPISETRRIQPRSSVSSDSSLRISSGGRRCSNTAGRAYPRYAVSAPTSAAASSSTSSGRVSQAAISRTTPRGSSHT